MLLSSSCISEDGGKDATTIHTIQVFSNVHNFKSKPFLPGKIPSLIPRSSRRKPGNEAGRFHFELYKFEINLRL